MGCVPSLWAHLLIHATPCSQQPVFHWYKIVGIQEGGERLWPYEVYVNVKKAHQNICTSVAFRQQQINPGRCPTPHAWWMAENGILLFSSDAWQRLHFPTPDLVELVTGGMDSRCSSLLAHHFHVPLTHFPSSRRVALWSANLNVDVSNTRAILHSLLWSTRMAITRKVSWNRNFLE